MHAEMIIDSEDEQEQMDAQQPENGEEQPNPDNGFPEAPPEQV